jgi:hypothetical protein
MCWYSRNWIPLHTSTSQRLGQHSRVDLSKAPSAAPMCPYPHGHLRNCLPVEAGSYTTIWLRARGISLTSPTCWVGSRVDTWYHTCSDSHDPLPCWGEFSRGPIPMVTSRPTSLLSKLAHSSMLVVALASTTNITVSSHGPLLVSTLAPHAPMCERASAGASAVH